MIVLALGPMGSPESMLKPWQGWLLTLLIGLGVIIKAKTSRLIITPERIERQGGLFQRETLSWPTASLKKVGVAAGLVQRILGVGVVTLMPKGDEPIIHFWGVASPRALKTAIERAAGLGP